MPFVFARSRRGCVSANDAISAWPQRIRRDQYARSALDIVVRHALSARGLDRASQPGFAARISAARLRGEADFLGQLAEILPRLASIAAAKDATQPKQGFPYTRLIFCHIPIVSDL